MGMAKKYIILTKIFDKNGEHIDNKKSKVYTKRPSVKLNSNQSIFTLSELTKHRVELGFPSAWGLSKDDFITEKLI
jgi:hypothetical protein